jgi:ATP-dependent Clp protease, protease subunit
VNIILNEDPESGLPPTDIFSKLAQDRVLFVGDLEDQEASDIIATLLLKDLEDSKEKITLVINSLGGDIRNAFMVYDMMQMITAPIETICIGEAWQVAVLILAGGKKGMRYATKNAAICPSQLVQDNYSQTDVKGVKDMLARSERDNKNMVAALSKATGTKVADLMKDLERQQYLSAKEAKAWGLIDKVLA